MEASRYVAQARLPPAPERLRLLDRVLGAEDAGADGSPLHLAVKCNHLNIAVMLLEHGADADAVRGDGYTALHLCAISGNAEVVRQLVGAGADATILSKAGVSAAQLALQYSHTEVAEAIDSSGGD